MLRSQDSGYLWLRKSDRNMKRTSGDADNVLFLDLIGGYMTVFNSSEFRALCTYDLCAFLHIGYAFIQLKPSILLPYHYIP